MECIYKHSIVCEFSDKKLLIKNAHQMEVVKKITPLVFAGAARRAGPDSMLIL